MVPNARFVELLTDIEPSPTTKANASAAHNSVRAHLRTHEDFEKRWVDDFLAGSYARDTAIRPKTTDDGLKRPDVDIIVETSFTTSDDPQDVLDEVRDALEDAFTIDRVNKRSVRIITANAEMDIVPVVAYGGMYQLPDRDLEAWKVTNPPRHTTWSTEQNTLFSQRFKPFVKLFKWWRRESLSGKRPKGFILEVFASLHAPTNETHYGEMFAKMLENTHAAYGWYAENNQKPFIADPAISSNDILSKVSMTDWLNFMERVRVHAGWARKAQGEDDMEEATRLWRRLFGDRFPATANLVKAADSVSYASAPTSNYVFPNTPAAPTRPRGFA
jgi:hypothetical protein